MRFLIIDDDEAVHMYLKKLLASYGDCDQCFNGKEAASLFEKSLDEKSPYSAIFLDILMPEMDGHETAQLLRKIEKKHGVSGPDEFKLVMITSLKDTKNVSQAFFKGYASCYIVKPFDKKQILQELKENKIL